MRCVENKIRVLHFPQIPCEPFIIDVQNEREAYLICNTLADQHLFLYKNRITPNYCNALIVEMLDEDSEWVDYWNKEEQMSFTEFEEMYLVERSEKDKDFYSE